jgi:hypothetical protein
MLTLTLVGTFPDADSEGAFVADLAALVEKYTTDLAKADLQTDFSGAPALPVGEGATPADDDGVLAANETVLAARDQALEGRVTALEGGITSVLQAIADLKASYTPPAPPA